MPSDGAMPAVPGGTAIENEYWLAPRDETPARPGIVPARPPARFGGEIATGRGAVIAGIVKVPEFAISVCAPPFCAEMPYTYKAWPVRAAWSDASGKVQRYVVPPVPHAVPTAASDARFAVRVPTCVPVPMGPPA